MARAPALGNALIRKSRLDVGGGGVMYRSATRGFNAMSDSGVRAAVDYLLDASLQSAR